MSAVSLGGVHAAATPARPDDIPSILAALERAHPPAFTPYRFGADLTKHTFVHVRGLAEFWRDGRTEELSSRWAEVLSGLHALGREVWVLVQSGGGDLKYLLVVGPAGEHADVSTDDTATRMLMSVLQEVDVNIVDSAKERAEILNPLAGYLWCAGARGVPLRPRGRAASDSSAVARLVRALPGAEWAYLTCLTPWPEESASTVRDDLARRMAVISPWIDRAVQGAYDATMHELDPHAQRLYDLIKAESDRLHDGRAAGLWSAEIRFLAQTRAAVDVFGGCIRGVAQGGSPSWPIEIGQCDPGAHVDPETPLSSSELAELTRPPAEEFPGFQIRTYARFDKYVGSAGADQGLLIGAVHGHPHAKLRVVRDDLTRHALVVGMTGSGKTTAVWSLLHGLAAPEVGIPFLVIEPVKREYRRMPLDPPPRVYTLGDDRVAPLRLNPFEVPDGTLVQTHIDMMNALFKAAFAMYAPMPFVLERCLYEVYADRGIDLAEDGGAVRGRFPTLGDLSAKIDQVVDSLGYGQEVTMNVRAALKTRVDTLRIGSKGMMLDTDATLDVADLLSVPTVVELERIGNDEEKAFLMGLLLMRILEHRQHEGPSAGGRLKHVTVVEEAHRLLRARPQSTDPESANPAAHAVEQFSNMLAEVRSLGEGLIIADQIASKLAPDVIKNTGLKLVFRTPAEDDKRSVGATINLTDEQSAVLTSLARGQALAFSEGMDGPVRIEVDGSLVLSAGDRTVTDDELRSRRSSAEVASWRSWPGLRRARSKPMDAATERLIVHWMLTSVLPEADQDASRVEHLLALKAEVASGGAMGASVLLGPQVCLVADSLLDRVAQADADSVARVRDALMTALAHDTDELAEPWLARARPLVGEAMRSLGGAAQPFAGCGLVCADGSCVMRRLVQRMASTEELSLAAQRALLDPAPRAAMRGLLGEVRARVQTSLVTEAAPTVPFLLTACCVTQAMPAQRAFVAREAVAELRAAFNEEV